MKTPKIPCSAPTVNGRSCKSYAIHDSDPPLCASHAGRTGAPKGNSNAVTHGFYQSSVSDEELAGEFTDAGEVTLVQEAALIRVTLQRLLTYLFDKDTPTSEILTVAPLVFAGTRALAFISKHLPDPNDIDWDAVLDRVSEETGWDV